MIEIRDPTAADEVAWRCLWNGYLDFYETMVPEEITVETWQRILDPKSGIFCRLAVWNKRVIGFTVSILHPGTWSATPVCYLEDLFVSHEARGSGAGRALINDLIAKGHASGWRKVYWQTRADNAAARRLYDTFATADGFVRYTVELR
jgi:GNAT superfamily N-acetyltransferase